MIDTLFLANQIESNLNTNDLGIQFLIFADEGDMQKTIKKGAYIEKYTHGLIETLSSTIVPIKNMNYLTITAQVMILVDLADTGYVTEGEKHRTQSNNLINIKQCVNELIQNLNGRVVNVEDENKTYTLTMGFNRPISGQKMSLGEISEGLPLYFTVTFNFFENGVNANDCKIIINNENIYFTRAVISKIKTSDQNEFAEISGGRTCALIGGKSIDLVIPCVNTDISRLIMQDILEDDFLNKAIAIRIETPLYSKNFIGILGNETVSMEAGTNLGYNISLVQGVEHLLSYDSNWKIEEVTGSEISKTLNGAGFVFWGDNKSDYVEGNKTITHIYADNKESHTIYIYRGV